PARWPCLVKLLESGGNTLGGKLRGFEPGGVLLEADPHRTARAPNQDDEPIAGIVERDRARVVGAVPLELERERINAWDGGGGEVGLVGAQCRGARRRAPCHIDLILPNDSLRTVLRAVLLLREGVAAVPAHAGRLDRLGRTGHGRSAGARGAGGRGRG